jgi:hypothetical protein
MGPFTASVLIEARDRFPGLGTPEKIEKKK